MADQDAVQWLHAQVQVSMVELAQCTGLPEPVLRELVECGALEPCDPQAAEWAFNAGCVAPVRAAARLCTDLELETASMALVLSLLERIGELEAQLRHLNALSRTGRATPRPA